MVDPPRPTPVHLVVDGANVVGSRPDGWWRDRPGAARRLASQLVAALPDADVHVHLVLEGAAVRAPDLPAHPALSVVRAEADGDSAIVALTGQLAATGIRIVVVTADRELRARVGGVGATTVGPAALRAALDAGSVRGLLHTPSGAGTQVRPCVPGP